jgi:hypothetical protein
MRYAAALGLTAVLFLSGVVCLSQAQVAQTGAGKGASGGAGCADTIPTITAPNDLTIAAWLKNNVTPATGGSYPSFGTTGSIATVSSTTTAFASTFQQVVGTLTSGVTYRITAFLKPSLGATWIAFGRSDTIANTFRVYFDVGAGVIGSNAIAGVATILTCSQISVAGSGFFKVDVAGSFTSVSNPFSVTFYPVDSDGSGNSTINQQFFVWGVGT